jgi:hypothetical protein
MVVRGGTAGFVARILAGLDARDSASFRNWATQPLLGVSNTAIVGLGYLPYALTYSSAADLVGIPCSARLNIQGRRRASLPRKEASRLGFFSASGDSLDPTARLGATLFELPAASTWARRIASNLTRWKRSSGQ